MTFSCLSPKCKGTVIRHKVGVVLNDPFFLEKASLHYKYSTENLKGLEGEDKGVHLLKRLKEGVKYLVKSDIMI